MFFEVKNLCFSYYKSPLCLKDINFSFAKNDKVAVLATKEMGKTTFLKVLSCFENNYFGKILLENKELKQIEDKDKNFSLLFSDPVFLERKTVRQNIEFQCKAINLEMPKDEVIIEMFKDFKFNVNLDTKLNKLSLLEKRKLAIIRSLIKNPKVMFLDDQIDGLEKSAKQEMLDIYGKLLTNKNLTLVFALGCNSFKFLNHSNGKLLINKILYLNLASCIEYKNINEFLNLCIDRNSVEFLDNILVIEAAVFKENNKYYLKLNEHQEFEISTEYNHNFDMLDLKFGDLEDCEIVIKEGFKDDLNKDSFNELINQNKLFVYYKLDGSRLV